VPRSSYIPILRVGEHEFTITDEKVVYFYIVLFLLAPTIDLSNILYKYPEAIPIPSTVSLVEVKYAIRRATLYNALGLSSILNAI
jgi:hypothetical protein